jgi:hypothetical protein
MNVSFTKAQNQGDSEAFRRAKRETFGVTDLTAE